MNLQTEQNFRKSFKVHPDVLKNISEGDIVEIAYCNQDGLQIDRFGRNYKRYEGEVSTINSKSVKFVGGYEQPHPFFTLNTGRCQSEDTREVLAIRVIGQANGYDREYFDIENPWIHTENGMV